MTKSINPPVNIVIFEKITYFSIAIGFLIGWITTPYFLVFVLFFGWIYILQFAFMYAIIKKGSQTASNYYCLMSILCAAYLAFMMYSPSFYEYIHYRRMEVYDYALSIIEIIVFILTVILLSSKSSTDWFKKMSEGQDIGINEFDGTKNLKNDAYKIYLTKKFNIEKNEVLGGYILEDKIFNTSNEALQEAFNRDVGLDLIVDIKIKNKRQPLNANAICPNCDSPINTSDESCWRCDASFRGDSEWKPLQK